jgi:two-component system chemotaxis response regulator CheB
VRQLLTELLSSDPDIEVVGAAPDPYRAWDMIQRLSPTVITLDVEMPKMDGLSFLDRLMRARPMPVVMVSSLTEQGRDVTLRALELGAVDFVTKPVLDVRDGLERLAEEIVEKVKAAAMAKVGAARQRPAPGPAPSAAPRLRVTLPVLGFLGDVVFAIGASTGGTEALRVVLSQLPVDSPGVVIVQHMPEHFTAPFASRLNSLCTVEVREARDGDRVEPGLALIAPGGVTHMEVSGRPGCLVTRLVDAPPCNHHRPSVDVLFRSCARNLGPHAVGALLTGMGADGAEGLLAMRAAGARTIAQDEATSVVYGMPKEAVSRGAAELQASIGSVAATMLRLSRPGKPQAVSAAPRSVRTPGGAQARTHTDTARRSLPLAATGREEK